jgi:hypothetical protein
MSVMTAFAAALEEERFLAIAELRAAEATGDESAMATAAARLADLRELAARSLERLTPSPG